MQQHTESKPQPAHTCCPPSLGEAKHPHCAAPGAAMDPGTRLHSSLLPLTASGNRFLTPQPVARWVPGNEASHWATLPSFLSLQCVLQCPTAEVCGARSSHQLPPWNTSAPPQTHPWLVFVLGLQPRASEQDQRNRGNGLGFRRLQDCRAGLDDRIDRDDDR